MGKSTTTPGTSSISDPPSDASASPKQSRQEGLDILNLAKTTTAISGHLYSYKTGDPHYVRQVFVSLREQALALYLENHPLVAFYQRGDATQKCAERERLATPLGTPFPIPYQWEDAPHTYYPDYVGKLVDGRPFVAEAGLSKAKRAEQALAKAQAAREYAQAAGGVFWIATEAQLGAVWHQNLQRLHSRRMPFPSYERIRIAFLSRWSWGTGFCVKEVVDKIGESFSRIEVEGAIWKLIGDAAASGHLAFDLTAQHLTRFTQLTLLDPAVAPILPDPLPEALAPLQTSAPSGGRPGDPSDPDSDLDEDDEDEDALLFVVPELPGLAINPTGLPEATRQRYERTRFAVYDVLHGARIRATAEKYQIGKSELARLTRRARTHGEEALIAHAIHKRPSRLHPDMATLIRKLHNNKQQFSMVAIREHPLVEKLAEKLTKKEGRTITVPSQRQVQLEIERFEREKKDPHTAPENPHDLERPTTRHPAHERMSETSYVRSIAGPAQVCQTDEYYWNGLVVAKDNTSVTMGVFVGVLICVKTAAILSYVMSPRKLIDEDYMLLVKRAIEPKTLLLGTHECKHDWNCSARPSVILHDGGRIFTSKLATEVVVDRLQIIEEKAPPYTPPAKGVVEALFQWIKERYALRMPGTTRTNREDRGAYESEAEAIKAGITFDNLEQYFVEAIVDDYMQQRDELRGAKRWKLWNDAVEEYGVVPYLGHADDLKLLLKRSFNRKSKTGTYKIHPSKGISFHHYWYVNPHVTSRLKGTEVTLYYSRRDITIVYVYLGYQYVGPVYNTYFTEPISEWEVQALRKRERVEQRASDDATRQTRTGILRRATGGRRAQEREVRAIEQRRIRSQIEAEVNPAEALAIRNAIQASREAQAADSAPVPPSGDPVRATSARGSGSTGGSFGPPAIHLPRPVPDSDDTPAPKPLKMYPVTPPESGRS